MAVLGELLINLKADTASLARDLAEAKSKVADAVEGIKGTLESLGVGLGLAELGRQFKDAISESVELGVTMENLAQRSGLSVEAMSGLSFAAKQSHVDAEALATGLKKLSVNMLDAATGTGQAAKFFQALGVSVTDVGGRLRPTEDVLMQLADVFHDLPDGAEKTALAVKLFGRSGSEMIPLLNQGRAGIQAFREEAQRAGVVIGEDFAKAAEQMEQKVNAMKAAWQGLAISFTESVMPLLNLKTFAGATNPLVSITQGVLDLKNALHGAGEEAKSAGSWFDKGLEAAHRLTAQLNVSKALGIGQTGAVSKQAEELGKLVEKLREHATATNMSAAATEHWHAANLGATAAAQETIRALQSYIGVQELSAKNLAGGLRMLVPPLDAVDQYLKRLADDVKRSQLNEEMNQLSDTLGKIVAEAKQLPYPFETLETKVLPPTKQSLIDINQITKQFEMHAIDAFASAIAHGKGFGEILRQLYEEVVQLIVKLTLMRTLESIGVNLGGFSIPGGLSGFAGGGAPTPGQPILVGEAGPEIFVPGSTGSIVPNSVLSAAGAGGGPHVQINYDFRGADASAEARLRQAADEITERSVATAVRAYREMSLRTIPGVW